MRTLETPVLVVGGGPVGLGTAIELGWRGIDCIVLEQGDGSVDHPRLGVILVRTMEFCRRWGIVDRVYNCGFNPDYKLDIVYCTGLNGFLLARDDNPSCADLVAPAESPEKRQRCPQIWFNPILEKAAAEYDSVRILHHCRLDDLVERADGVEGLATDLRTGERLRIRADYLIACDGATSIARDKFDVRMMGNPALSYSVNLFVRSPDLRRAHGMGDAERYLFVGPEGTWANMTVVDGRELWRFTFLGSEQKLDLATFDPARMIERCLGRNDVPYDLISVKPWRRTELTAEKFRFGRVFLAGDSAHTMSPTGGFGMSTGIADAVDLGWKLEAVFDGWAGPDLLDSYEMERRPAAVRACSASARNYRAWRSAPDCAAILDATAEGEAVRRSVGAHMREAGREDWDCLGMQLGYVYEDSPICVPDGTPPPPDSPIDYVPVARPGSRAPHAWLPDGRSMLDLFGRGFTLLRMGWDAPSPEPLARAARAQAIPLQVVEIPSPQIAELYAGRLVLVRPDGHVAWRGDECPSDPEAVMATVRGARSAQTGMPGRRVGHPLRMSS